MSDMQVMAQLAFDGNCRQAFERYEQVLNGKIMVMNSLGDTADVPLPPGSKPSAPEHIRFAQLRIGDSALLGNDVPHDEFEPMRGFNIALHTHSVADAIRIFDALAEGGKVSTPLTEVAWAARFGQLVDRFGTPWLILALTE
jgi:PhnB protein